MGCVETGPGIHSGDSIDEEGQVGHLPLTVGDSHWDAGSEASDIFGDTVVLHNPSCPLRMKV